MMNRTASAPKHWFIAVVVVLLTTSGYADEPSKPRQRRILYNLDGCSPLVTRAGSKGPVSITVKDLKWLIEEVTYEGSQVDTILCCVNAQVTFYPTKVGTMLGENSTAEERAKWAGLDRQWVENMRDFLAAGIDPHAVLFAETREQGREALLSFRMNDDHGNDFLRTKFWNDHLEYRLGKGSLDFGHAAVREYTFQLIEEAMRRYDCDGLEMDFNRFPLYFKDGTTDERIATINALVERIRKLLDVLGQERGRRLVLCARVPSDFGKTPPSYEHSREVGCDPAAWAKHGWIDFLTVSDFYFQRYCDLPIAPWKAVVRDIPVYGGIEARETTDGPAKDQYLTADKYRRAAKHLWSDGADGIYLFNFFTTRELDAESFEPPFEILKDIGNPLHP